MYVYKKKTLKSLKILIQNIKGRCLIFITNSSNTLLGTFNAILPID